MGSVSIPQSERVGVGIIEFVLILTWTFSILALYNMEVYDADHCHSLSLVFLNAFREVSHIMNLD